MRYAVVIERAKRNYSAYCPDVPGCVATGPTVAETVQRMRQALTLHLAGLSQDGDHVPDPSTLVEYLDVALPAQSPVRLPRKAS